MSKFKIERPDPYKFCDKDFKLDDDAVQKWFTAVVEPVNKMLSEGVEVDCLEIDRCDWWLRECDNGNKAGIKAKALLINIESIKKETAKDILRYLLDHTMVVNNAELENRIKAALEEE